MRELAQQFGPHALIIKLRREFYRNLGACLSPHNAWLQSIGLETLELRALKLVPIVLIWQGFFQSMPEVVQVNYPGLEGSEYYELCKKQFSMPGAVLTFRLKSKESCFRFYG
jgi:O-acetylhomoserine (thiol)-lyase